MLSLVLVPVMFMFFARKEEPEPATSAEPMAGATVGIR
jgi:hypothetical protein